MKKTLFLLLLSLSLVIGQQSTKCGPDMEEVATGNKTSCAPKPIPPGTVMGNAGGTQAMPQAIPLSSLGVGGVIGGATPTDGQLLRYSASTQMWIPVTLVDREVPGGTIDGRNAAFTLANVPNPPAGLIVKRNGLEQMPSGDYTLSSGTITFTAASIPQTGDTISVSYRY